MEGYRFYLSVSGEHGAVRGLIDTLAEDFERIGSGKCNLDVLGVGSGGGEMDIHILSTLQSVFPSLPITADVVEPCVEFTEDFKALVAKTSSLQNILFEWHAMTSEEYEKNQVHGVKRFDFIHMIQVMSHVDDHSSTVRFFHSLLKEHGALLIVHEAGDSGWALLWKAYRKALWPEFTSDYLSAGDIKSHLDRSGLRYDEVTAHNSFDITDCFDLDSPLGERLLDSMTAQEHFHRSLTPELRKGILDLLRNKCSTEKDGRVMFNSNLSCMLVHA